MSSGKIVDLRGKGGRKSPPEGQRPLFSTRPPEPRRAMPLRARRRRWLALKIFAVVLVIAGAVWGVSYASYLPQFSVQTINISGAENVPADLIQSYALTILDDGSHHFISRDNIFIYPRAVLERDIVGYFPRINSASVSRPDYFSTTLDIQVTERQPYALWCDDSGSCYQMDSGGFIFAEASASSTPDSARPQTSYIFKGGLSDPEASSTPGSIPSSPIGESYVPAHLPGIVALLKYLGQSGFNPEGVTVESDQDFSIPLTEGFFLKASFGEDAETLTHNLQLVLAPDALQGKEAELEYVDLRFGDRVYYKLNGQDQATSPVQ